MLQPPENPDLYFILTLNHIYRGDHGVPSREIVGGKSGLFDREANFQE